MGDTSDILGALQDVFDTGSEQTEKVEPEETIKEQTASDTEDEQKDVSSDEIDDIRLFKEETAQNFNLIQSKVNEFNFLGGFFLKCQFRLSFLC